jgi:hypothetical protein
MRLTSDNNVTSNLIIRGTIPPFPQYVFVTWCLVKHRDNFPFHKVAHLSAPIFLICISSV